MLTARGAGMLGTAVALWVAARATGLHHLQMVAVAALALLALALLSTLRLSDQLIVDRVVRPGRIPFDDVASVTLTLGNAGRRTPRLELEDMVPPSLAERPRVTVEPVRTHGRAKVRYRLQGAQRGRFLVGPARLTYRDPFGLVVRRRVVPGRSRIVVEPPVYPLPHGLPLGGSTSSGSRSRRLTPVGEDLADVREYVQGDDLRTVHWSTTAHRGTLMVRQSETPFEPRATVVLDVQADRHRGTGRGASIETAVAAAASAGNHLITRGRAVLLLDRPITSPVRSLPWVGWLDVLAATVPEPVDLAALFQQLGHGLGGDGTLIAVVTPPRPGELRRLVRAGRGFSTRTALVVDVDSHGSPPSDTPAASEAAASLTAAGWRATIVRRGDRIEERWRELIAHRRTSVGAGR